MYREESYPTDLTDSQWVLLNRLLPRVLAIGKRFMSISVGWLKDYRRLSKIMKFLPAPLPIRKVGTYFKVQLLIGRECGCP